MALHSGHFVAILGVFCWLAEASRRLLSGLNKKQTVARSWNGREETEASGHHP